MTEGREPKKSETLEVRLTHEAKLALMRKAQAEGRSASDVVRDCIGAYLVDQPKEARSMLITVWKPAAAVGAAAVAIVWSALAPTSAMAGPDLRATFEHFDRDHNGSVTLAEFRASHPGVRFGTPSRPITVPPTAGPVMVVIRREGEATCGKSPTAAQLLKAQFDLQDSSGNGSVDFVEFEAFHQSLMKAAFGSADADKSGRITPAELARIDKLLPSNAPPTDFQKVDRNADGALTEDEYLAYLH
jgi:Ca2+-binding EF-hand superfamily protein